MSTNFSLYFSFCLCMHATRFTLTVCLMQSLFSLIDYLLHFMDIIRHLSIKRNALETGKIREMHSIEVGLQRADKIDVSLLRKRFDLLFFIKSVLHAFLM